MEGERLKEIGEKLEVSEEDMKAMRRERLMEKWLYPVTGALVSLGATILGFIMGKNADPIKRDGGYPFTRVTPEAAALFCGLPLTALLSVIAALWFRKNPTMDTKRKRMVVVLLSLVFAVLGFVVTYGLARPVEYYEDAIDYGVYSRDTRGGL